MATKAKPRKKGPDILDQQQSAGTNDWIKFVEQVKANPLMYGAVAAFLLLCVAAGLIYRVGTTAGSRSAITQLAKAVDTEDATLRADELSQVAKAGGKVGAEALYFEGEARFDAKDYAKAREIFEQVRSQYPDTPYAPNALEGLGNISETEGKPDQAIASYKEIIEKWPTSLTAKRQQLNIGRCDETLENLKDAVAAYQAQVDAFPGSSAAKEAQNALDRLKKTNPDLFPKEAPPEAAKPASTGGEAPAAPEKAAPAMETPAPAPAVETPAPAPVPAPAAESPAPAPPATSSSN